MGGIHLLGHIKMLSYLFWVDQVSQTTFIINLGFLISGSISDIFYVFYKCVRVYIFLHLFYN